MTKSRMNSPPHVDLQELQALEDNILEGIETLKGCGRILLHTVSLQNDIISGFYNAVAHGDDEHRRWLKETVDAYLASYSPRLAALSHRISNLASRPGTEEG